MSTDTEFWQGRYLSGDTPWDKGEAAPPLMEYLSSVSVDGKVCVPGCGAGYDARALASQGAEVTGMDIAPAALEKAHSYDAVNNESFHQIDFLNLPDSWHGKFDWIFEHTCFCAINPSRRSDYVRSCVQALKPGGKLLAIFFMKPDTEPGEGPPFGTTDRELDELFLPYFEIISDVTPSQAYPGREGRERLRVLQRKT